MQAWNVLHAARWNTGCKISPKIHHLDTIGQLCRAMASHLRHISTIGKIVLSINISSRCPHNMSSLGPLSAEIDPVVWGTPANFNGFRVLASWQHYCTASSSGRQPNFAALNRGRHLCSAGRPSGWALAHILVGWVKGRISDRKTQRLSFRTSEATANRATPGKRPINCR